MVFYRSFFEAINGLPAENRLELYEAIMAFGLNNQMPELRGVNASIFTLIHPQLVANQRRYENGTRTKKPRGNQPEVVSAPAPQKTMQKTTPKFQPPNLEEVVEFFVGNGYTKTSAEKAFTYYMEGGWKDGNGRPVKNWRQKMRGVWFRPEHKEASVANNAQVYTMPTNYRPTL